MGVVSVSRTRIKPHPWLWTPERVAPEWREVAERCLWASLPAFPCNATKSDAVSRCLVTGDVPVRLRADADGGLPPIVHGQYGAMMLQDGSPINEGFLYSGPANALLVAHMGASPFEPCTFEAVFSEDNTTHGKGLLGWGPLGMNRGLGGVFNFIVYTSGSYGYSGGTLPTGWVMVHGVYSGGLTVTLYANGKRYAPSTGTGTTSGPGTGIMFGGGSDFNNSLPGKILFGAIYNRAFSQADVTRRNADWFGPFRPAVRRVAKAPSALTLTQSRYRWRLDDGDEDGATWAEAENGQEAIAVGEVRRLRAQVAATGDPASGAYKLQVREQGGTWSDVTPE